MVGIGYRYVLRGVGFVVEVAGGRLRSELGVLAW